MAEFQWGKWGQDNPLRKEVGYDGVNFLGAGCMDGAETSVTVRPVCVEDDIGESEEEEFEDEVETEKKGEEV